MKRILTIVILVALAGTFAGTGYFLYQKSEEPEMVFEIDSVFISDIVKKTVATGSIIPRKEVEIKSQVSGVVEKLFVQPGENVEVGDLIAKIRIIPNVVALNNAEARLNTVTINFENAQKELNRQRDLFEEKVISDFEFNQFVLDYDLLKQQVEAAQNNLELIREGASKKSGNVSNLVKSTVRGMILDVPVKEGSFVIESNTFNDGTSIAAIADVADMIFEGMVDESEVGKLQTGMDLNLSIGALEKETFNASLEYISPKGIEEEGAIQFEIRASVDLKDGSFLRAGYSANADIVLEKREEVLAIRESNLIFEEDKVFVEIESGPQTFEKREISTGLSDGINIEVLTGIQLPQKVKKI